MSWAEISWAEHKFTDFVFFLFLCELSSPWASSRNDRWSWANWEGVSRYLSKAELCNNAGADPGGGFWGSWPPPALDHQFCFSTNFLTSQKKKIKKNRSEYSMDAMYLNLMFINPRPPVGADAKGARSTRPSLTPPCKKSWIRACNGPYLDARTDRISPHTSLLPSHTLPHPPKDPLSRISTSRCSQSLDQSSMICRQVVESNYCLLCDVIYPTSLAQASFKKIM